MTDYKRTDEDAKDDLRLANISIALGAIAQARATLAPKGVKLDGLWKSLHALTEDEERLNEESAFIGRKMDERVDAFYSDRSKVKRAAARLRKEFGYVVSLSEPQDRNSARIDKAADEGTLHAMIRRSQFDYAFEVKGTAGWRGGRGDAGETLTGTLYLSWGPINGAMTAERFEYDEDTYAIGSTIAYVLADEGLDVEWDGSGSDCVTVVPSKVEEDVAV